MATVLSFVEGLLPGPVRRGGALLGVALALGAVAGADEPRNPRIDMERYLGVAQEASRHRQTRRVSEREFLRLAALPGTIVLDARSREKYDQLHVRGAVNLSFPDISVESLRRVLPDRKARVLIYCNNNFVGNESAFPRKLAEASLNLSTYIALYSYGYREIYELAPLLDVSRTALALEASARP